MVVIAFIAVVNELAVVVDSIIIGVEDEVLCSDVEIDSVVVVTGGSEVVGMN